MRPFTVRLVAARELQEAMRSRWFVLAAACFLVLSFALSLLGLAGAQQSGLAGFDRTTASLLNLALVFVPLVTLSLGGLSIAGELEDQSLPLLLAQPITRLEVFAGKYLGLLAAVFASICVGFGITGIAVGWTAGGNARAFASLVALAVLLAATTLAVGMLLSVGLRVRTRVIAAVFSAWLVLVYLSDLGTIGLAIARNLGPAEVFALALLNPVQPARILGTLALSDRVDVLGPAALFGIDLFGRAGLVAFLIGTLLVVAVTALGAGYALFRKEAIT